VPTVLRWNSVRSWRSYRLSVGGLVSPLEGRQRTVGLHVSGDNTARPASPLHYCTGLERLSAVLLDISTNGRLSSVAGRGKIGASVLQTGKRFLWVAACKNCVYDTGRLISYCCQCCWPFYRGSVTQGYDTDCRFGWAQMCTVNGSLQAVARNFYVLSCYVRCAWLNIVSLIIWPFTFLSNVCTPVWMDNFELENSYKTLLVIETWHINYHLRVSHSTSCYLIDTVFYRHWYR
jgi:hypothetical protein